MPKLVPKLATSGRVSVVRFGTSAPKRSSTVGASYPSSSQTASEDLRERLPGVSSFSVTNLRYMRYFYELYPDAENPQQPVEDSAGVALPRGAGDESLGDIFLIPWGHHVVLLGRCRDDRDKALFYVRKTLENGWSRAVQLNFLDSGLYEREGAAVTNFASTLLSPQSDLASAVGLTAFGIIARTA